MISPLTMSFEDMEEATDEEIIAAYMADGFDRETAEAYLAAVSNGLRVD